MYSSSKPKLHGYATSSYDFVLQIWAESLSGTSSIGLGSRRRWICPCFFVCRVLDNQFHVWMHISEQWRVNINTNLAMFRGLGWGSLGTLDNQKNGETMGPENITKSLDLPEKTLGDSMNTSYNLTSVDHQRAMPDKHHKTIAHAGGNRDRKPKLHRSPQTTGKHYDLFCWLGMYIYIYILYNGHLGFMKDRPPAPTPPWVISAGPGAGT